MTDVMLLDLSSDDGLLVPFKSHPAPLQSESKPSSNSTKNKNRINNNNHETNNSSRGLGRFFSRPRIPQETPTPQENAPLKVTTFAFPKARVEQADEFLPEPSTDKEPQDDADDNDGDSDERSEEESEKEGGKRKKSSSTIPKPAAAVVPPPPQKSLRRVDEWDPHQNPWYEEKEESRSWRVEGYGNTPMPQNDDSSKGLGGLFRSWRGGGGGGRRRNADDDLRSMKVATEDTKDDKTILEHIGKAALVVLIPELYADEEDGDGNLGMYRSINANDDDDGGEKGVLKKEPDEVSMLRAEVNQLRLKVLRLEKELKSSELEAGSWKLRCTEVEKELRRYKRQSDDDSSVDALECGESDEADINDDDDGIDEEWTEFSGVKEGNLLDMSKVEAKGDPEPTTASDRPEAEPNLFDTETTVGTSVITDEEPDLMDLQDHKLVFDPLATK